MKEAYDPGTANGNPMSTERKPRKVRRVKRAERPSRSENATADMAAHLRARAAGYDDDGAIIPVTDEWPLPTAALQEWINEDANAGRLLIDIDPGQRLVEMGFSSAFKLVKHLARPQLLPAAALLIQYLTALNGGRVPYIQRHVDAPGGIQVLLRGHYAGPRDVQMIVDGYPFAIAMTTGGFFSFTGRVVVPVAIARKGKLYEAQRMLDRIAESARRGEAFDLDAYVLSQVQS